MNIANICRCIGTLGSIAILAFAPEIARSQELRPHTDSNPGLKCIVSTQRQTFRDASNYPGAYETGYQQGTAARMTNTPSQPPAEGGELARGYLDGYQLKTYAGQIVTVPTENRVNCGCRTQILKDVYFKENLEAFCRDERESFTTGWSNAYNPTAYVDGYREGIASKAKRENYQVRSVGGEFARGFEDGYFGRKSTGQRYTEPLVTDYRCKCRLIIRRNDRDVEY